MSFQVVTSESSHAGDLITADPSFDLIDVTLLCVKTSVVSFSILLCVVWLDRLFEVKKLCALAFL